MRGACALALQERAEGWGEGRPVSDPVVDKIVAHLARVAADGVPEAARAAAQIFIADTLAVGVAGAGAAWRGAVLDTARAGPEEASAWGGGGKLPLPAAAM